MTLIPALPAPVRSSVPVQSCLLPAFSRRRWPLALGFLPWMLYLSSLTLSAQPFWQPLVGPWGGDVHVLTESRTRELYLGSGAGLYTRARQAARWSPSPDSGLMRRPIYALLQTSEFWVAATDSGVWYTDNPGTWREGTANLNPLPVSHLAHARDDASVLALQPGEGVFSWRVGSPRWEPLYTDTLARTFRALLTGADGRILLADSQRVYRNNPPDGALTPSPLPLPDGAAIQTLLAGAGDRVYYAGTDAGVFRTTDGGVIWTPYGAGLDNSRVRVLALDPASGTLFAGTRNGVIYRLPPDSSLWEREWVVPAPSAITALHVLNPDQLLAGTERYGLIRRDIPGSWSPYNTGLQATQVDALAAPDSSMLLAVLHKAGLHRSLDGGQAWDAISTPGSDQILSLSALDPDTLWVGMLGAGLCWRTDNGGDTWTQVSDGLDTYAVTALVVEDSLLFAGTINQGVYRSADRGATWIPMNDSLLDDQHITVLAVHPSGQLVAGTRNGQVFAHNPLNPSWLPLGSRIEGGTVNDLAFNRGDTLFLASNRGIFRFEADSGDWRLMLPPTRGTLFHTLALGPGDSLYAGSNNRGVLVASGTGTDWQTRNDGLTGRHVRTLIRTAGDRLLAGTYGHGIYRSDTATRVIGRTPVAGWLQAPPRMYPNPARDRLTLELVTNQAVPLEIRVVDLQGRPLASLYSGRLPHGPSRLPLDLPTDTPTGPYWLTIRTPFGLEALPLWIR